MTKIDLATSVEVDTDEIIKLILDWYGLKISEKYLVELLKGSPQLSLDVEVHGFDTMAREITIELIAYDLCDMSWPLNGDKSIFTQKYQTEFLGKLISAVNNNPEIEMVGVEDGNEV